MTDNKEFKQRTHNPTLNKIERKKQSMSDKVSVLFGVREPTKFVIGREFSIPGRSLNQTPDEVIPRLTIVNTYLKMQSSPPLKSAPFADALHADL